MEEIVKVVVPAVVGLIAGAIGSLIAPWVNWGIEKRKLQLAARREFIAAARKALDDSPSKRDFRESGFYSQLRPLLSASVRESIESDTIVVQLGGRGSGADNFVPQVLDEIHALEKKWELF